MTSDDLTSLIGIVIMGIHHTTSLAFNDSSNVNKTYFLSEHTIWNCTVLMVCLFLDSGHEFGKWIWLVQYASPPPLCLAVPLVLSPLQAWHPVLSHCSPMLKQCLGNTRALNPRTAVHPAWCGNNPLSSAKSQRPACSSLHRVALFDLGVSLLKHLSCYHKAIVQSSF